MLNKTDELVQKINDIVSLLNVYMEEAKLVEAARNALENSQNVATQREIRLNERDLAQNQKEKELDGQKKYIEDKGSDTQTVLNKIALEKKELEGLTEQKRVFEQEKQQFEIEKKRLEGLQKEKEEFDIKKIEFEQERQLFSKEKLALNEQTRLLVLREANVKSKEERYDKIERMTAV